MSVITIIGAGMMGSAMAYPACENGNEVRLVGTHLDDAVIAQAMQTGIHPTLNRLMPRGVQYYQIADVEKALHGASLVIGGVSSFGVDWFADRMLPLIPRNVPLLSITKGLASTPEGGLISYPALYAESAGGAGLSLNAVGGPCTSYELVDRDPTEVCFCGADIATLRKIKAMLETDYYHISLSTDVFGVECAVALKNAYALGVTLAVGLSEKKDGKVHYNSQAALFGQSIREMRHILSLYGGRDENIYLGAGDLYVTVFGGRTRLIGTLLGKGYSIDAAMAELKGITLESLVIAKRTATALIALSECGKADKADFPLLLHISAVLSGNETVNIPWRAFETEMI